MMFIAAVAGAAAVGGYRRHSCGFLLLLLPLPLMRFLPLPLPLPTHPKEAARNGP